MIRSDKVSEEENWERTVFDDGPRTAFNWEVHAPSLERLLLRLTNDYGANAIVVTENGASYPTTPDENGGLQTLSVKPISSSIFLPVRVRLKMVRPSQAILLGHFSIIRVGRRI